jgi:hypothetical protein
MIVTNSQSSGSFGIGTIDLTIQLLSMKRILLFTALFLMGNAAQTFGDSKPLQLALVNPIQVVHESNDISGLRINLIYGKNENVTGLDFGFANYVMGDFRGLQLGCVNHVFGNTRGWQDAFVNITQGELNGLQTGFVNYSGKAHGLQFGLINYTEDLQGLQIGVLNFNANRDPLGFFPIVNWSF